MANPTLTYRQNAAKCFAEAETATLENVRERNLRAADAWTKMAERQERTDHSRAVREAAVASGQGSTASNPG